jgi:hypothetical protein
MGDVVQFVPRPNPNREYDRQKRLNELAQSVFSEVSIGGPLAENLQLIGEPKEPA